VQMDIAGASWAIGIRTEGAAVHEHLNKAKQAFAAAEQSYAEMGQEEGRANARVGVGLIL